jgi:hypothetical protein
MISWTCYIRVGGNNVDALSTGLAAPINCIHITICAEAKIL